MTFMSLLLFTFVLIKVAGGSNTTDAVGEFSFYGLVKLEGELEVDSTGVITLTNSTLQDAGSVFYASPVRFKNSTDGDVLSFSTTYVFAQVPDESTAASPGFAFVFSPSKEIRGALNSDNLGPFDDEGGGNSSNTIVVGLDRFLDNPNVKIDSGRPIQAWVEYNGTNSQFEITTYSIPAPKPDYPLVRLTMNLSSYMNEYMYVGFASYTGKTSTTCYVLGWNFKVNGEVQAIDLSRLPDLPIPNASNSDGGYGKMKKILAVVLSLTGATFVLVLVFGILLVSRKRRQREVLEDWEVQYGPHKFTYKELFVATKGFKDKELLGKGGFGRVYRGSLPVSNVQIAVKRVSHDSKQGLREFVAEIATIGRLRHPNLVRLQGYCRRKNDLFLVYDYMPNASLDKFLYGQADHETLSWPMRYKIIRDVAAALFYLHQQWVQVVIHRDIKASNVLLDADMNGRLGDFGLAKLVDRGTDPQTSMIAGTFGYIAPELSRTGRASTSTDMYAFGVFMLEVVCGRKPVKSLAPPDEIILVDWVNSYVERGTVLEVVDPRLGKDYKVEEVEQVLKLGIWCTHNDAKDRPSSMSTVLQYMNGLTAVPDDSSNIRDDPYYRPEPVDGENAIDISSWSFNSESILMNGR